MKVKRGDIVSVGWVERQPKQKTRDKRIVQNTFQTGITNNE